MAVDFINAGHGNIISAHRVVAITHTSSAPIKKMIKDARAENRLIDISSGRKMRSAIIMDSNQIVLSSIQPETIANRLYQMREQLKKGDVNIHVEEEEEDIEGED